MAHYWGIKIETGFYFNGGGAIVRADITGVLVGATCNGGDCFAKAIGGFGGGDTEIIGGGGGGGWTKEGGATFIEIHLPFTSLLGLILQVRQRPLVLL